MAAKKGSAKKGRGRRAEGVGKAAKKGGVANKEKARRVRPVKASAAGKAGGGAAETDKRIVEWRKSLMQPAERAMIDYFLYPVAKNRSEKRAAKKIMVESYIKGDEVVKQFILFLVHEQLSRSAGLRMMHNFAHFRKAMEKETNAGEVRKAVYRTIFNYTTSLEGITELLEFLGELGDEGAAKLISYHLSFYTSAENPAFAMLRNASFDALGECNCTYALEILLSHARYGERSGRALYALQGWEKKLGSLGLNEEDKKRYSKDISGILGKREKHEYYR